MIKSYLGFSAYRTFCISFNFGAYNQRLSYSFPKIENIVKTPLVTSKGPAAVFCEYHTYHGGDMTIQWFPVKYFWYQNLFLENEILNPHLLFII